MFDNGEEYGIKDEDIKEILQKLAELEKLLQTYEDKEQVANVRAIAAGAIINYNRDPR